jgi:two-component SAPR family response regulator
VKVVSGTKFVLNILKQESAKQLSSDIALEKFKPYYYGLLLLDIKMPGITGFELYEEINKFDARVHVILITAFEVYYESLKEIYPDLVPSSFIQQSLCSRRTASSKC